MTEQTLYISSPIEFVYRAILAYTKTEVDDDGVPINGQMAYKSRVFLRYFPNLHINIVKDDFADIFITHVESYQKIYILMANLKPSLDEMSSRLQTFYNNESRRKVLINPFRGQPAMTIINDCFFRCAVILRPDPVQVKVFIVDRGDSLVIHKSRIFELDSTFLDLPPQAIAVKISEISASEECIPVHIFTNLVVGSIATCRFDDSINDVFVVSLVMTIDEKLYNLGKLVTCETSIPDWLNEKFQSMTCLPIMNTDFKEPDEPTPRDEAAEFAPVPDEAESSPLLVASASLDKSVATSISTVDSSPIACFSMPTFSFPINDMAQHPIEDTDNPGLFFVHLDRFESQLEVMLESIRPSTRVLDNAQIGSACLGTFMGDWYRAQVIAIEPANRLSIRFVDYGNVETKADNQVFQVDEHQLQVVKSMPSLAIPCILAGVQPKQHGVWSRREIATFNRLFPEGCKTEFEGTHIDDNGRIVCNLSLGNCHLSDVFNSMIDNDYASPPPPISAPVSAPAPQETSLNLPFLSLTLPLNKPATLLDDVDHVIPSKFFLILSELTDQFNSVHNQLVPPTCVLASPNVDQHCICSYQNAWYRARVVHSQGDMVRVRFVDYGNELDKSKAEVFALTDEQPQLVLTCPPLAISCKLAEIEPTNGFEWSPDELTVFRNLLKSSPILNVSANGIDPQGLILCDLITDAATSAVDTMKHCRSGSTSFPDFDAAWHPTRGDLCLHGVLSGTVERSDDHTGTPGLFFIQLRSNFDALSSVVIEPPTIPLIDPVVGQRCLAEYQECWYRAQVVSVLDTTVTVHYFDYGNTECKPRTDIFAIGDNQPATVRTVAKQAIPCKLGMVRPVQGDRWSDEEVQLFNRLFPEGAAAQVEFSELDKDDHIVRINLSIDGHDLVGTFETERDILADNNENERDIGPKKMLSQLKTPPKEEIKQSNDYEQFLPSLPLVDLAFRCDGCSTGPDRFYVHLAQLNQQIIDINQSVKPPSTVLIPVRVGDRCLAQYLDDWYRARVIHIDDDDRVRIRFVDYGNEEIKTREELFQVGDDQSEVVKSGPIVATPCTLIGNQSWTEYQKELFNKMFPNDSMIRIEAQEIIQDVVLCDLKRTDDKLMSQLLQNI